MVVRFDEKGVFLIKNGGNRSSKGVGLQDNDGGCDCPRRVGTTVRGCGKKNCNMS